MNTGEKIKDLRVRNGLTQQELGDIIGVSAQRVSAIEGGKNKISLSLFNKIINELGYELRTIKKDK